MIDWHNNTKGLLLTVPLVHHAADYDFGDPSGEHAGFSGAHVLCAAAFPGKFIVQAYCGHFLWLQLSNRSSFDYSYEVVNEGEKVSVEWDSSKASARLTL